MTCTKAVARRDAGKRSRESQSVIPHMLTIKVLVRLVVATLWLHLHLIVVVREINLIKTKLLADAHCIVHVVAHVLVFFVVGDGLLLGRWLAVVSVQLVVPLRISASHFFFYHDTLGHGLVGEVCSIGVVFDACGNDRGSCHAEVLGLLVDVLWPSSLRLSQRALRAMEASAAWMRGLRGTSKAMMVRLF